MKQYKLVNRALAGVVFIIGFITYAMTLQPSVPFWDCGEFTAAMTWQQVQHPPGAPLWLIVGHVLQMINPFGTIGWRANLGAGFFSALTAMLAYLIIVKVIERWHPQREGRPIREYLPTFGGALVGSLAFMWSDSQWFNSVESEVYAMATFLAALLVWLMMRWNDHADEPGHERYLLMMAYVLGLAIGTHLLALLVFPAIALVIYFRIREFSWVSFIALLAITGVSFFVFVYKAPLQYIPELLSNSTAAGVLLLAAVLALCVWAARQHQPVVFVAASSLVLIVLGYTTYTQVLIRSNSNPPLNFGEPDTFGELVGYLGRQQYGNRPDWPRRVETDQYYRRYQDQYGEWYPPSGVDAKGNLIFPKVNVAGELNFMWQYQIEYMYFRYLLWNFYGRASDEYGAPAVAISASEQVRQQYIAPSGYDDYFPVVFYGLPLILGLIGLFYQYRRDWKMGFVYTTLFLFLGVLAALQQQQQQPQPRERDYFYAASFMIFAVWIGVGAAGLAESLGIGKTDEETAGGDNATEEPARTYSTRPLYAGAPPATGLGAKIKPGVAGAILGVCMLAVPINMVAHGWRMHDRSGNWVPWDYAYNILQSCEPNAILFTNGDNDTFPLWFLQDVNGVRRDVRVVNLSLGQMGWYIYQLKHNTPWGAKKVPISIPDDVLKQPEGAQGGLNESQMKPPTVNVPVPADVMKWATDGEVTTPGVMHWTYTGVQYGNDGTNRYRIYHQLIRDIIETNAKEGWERPIYFCTSIVDPENFAGLGGYLRNEGLAYRVMPVQQQPLELFGYALDEQKMKKEMFNLVPTDTFYTEPHRGFILHNLNNPNVFYMYDHRRIPTGSYRLGYLALARQLANEGKDAEAIAALDTMASQISSDIFPVPYPFEAEIAKTYRDAGAVEKAKSYARQTLRGIDAAGAAAQQGGGSPELTRAEMLAVIGDYDAATAAYKELQKNYPGQNSEWRRRIEEMQLRRHLDSGDVVGAQEELKRIIAGYDTTQPGASNNIELLRRIVRQHVNPLDKTSTSDTINLTDTATGK